MEDTQALCRRLVSHFTFEPGEIPPDLSGFRAKEGMSFTEFLALCEQDAFRAALREARERYLDTLTAGALLKKYDATFVRHLLDAEREKNREEDDGGEPPFTVEIRVVE
ncbi:MAG: hypothetical protein J6V07_04370 [Clostridia bacterium]|nr:hypothetical protein [Clostridia bacterium]